MRSFVVDRPLHWAQLESIVERVRPLAVVGDIPGLGISDVVFDHRKVSPGALFCCIPGAHTDGHRFARSAYEAGAVAFLCERSLGDEVGHAPRLVVAPGTARAAMALAACAFYEDPSNALRCVGVTGTNGKTTTTYLLRSICEAYGWPTGVIGTLDGARTTPESPELQAELARQRDLGRVVSAIEVTSHGLVQHRVDGMRFDVAVFTNLTQDHLDFHKTMESYFEAKAELFTPERTRLAVVNGDDPYGRRLAERAAVPTATFSLADVRDLEVGIASTTFRLGGRTVRLGLGGEVNVRNALAAAAAARALDVSPDAIVAGLESAPAVPGRFEVIESADGVVAVVDFAHTTAGLESVLLASRQAIRAGRRVTVVFGCGGDRDRGKRPSMGAVASQRADLVVLTSDNPRSEDPMSIIADIRAGVRPGERVHVELDRRQAILGAIRDAEPGDIVIVAGKGHETTQQFADESVHFDDREVVRECFVRLGRGVRRDRSAGGSPT